MANTVKAAAKNSDRSGPVARRALIEAAKELLVERAPSTVRGRELAERAGVNYGLVHHYFGTATALFREALLELRAEFIERHPRLDFPELVGPDDPYLLALGRSQIDYPSALGSAPDFPVGQAVVAALRERLGGRYADGEESPLAVEAKARAVALMALQLGYGLFQSVLEETAGVVDADRAAVREVLGSLYRGLAMTEPS